MSVAKQKKVTRAVISARTCSSLSISTMVYAHFSINHHRPQESSAAINHEQGSRERNSSNARSRSPSSLKFSPWGLQRTGVPVLFISCRKICGKMYVICYFFLRTALPNIGYKDITGSVINDTLTMCILNHLGCFKKIQILRPHFCRLQLGKMVRGLGTSNFIKVPKCS